MLMDPWSIRLATEPHSLRQNKILITEYDFAVNVVMVINITVHKEFIVMIRLINYLYTKMSLAKTSIFSML